jgi:hypothetical protein
MYSTDYRGWENHPRDDLQRPGRFRPGQSEQNNVEPKRTIPEIGRELERKRTKDLRGPYIKYGFQFEPYHNESCSVCQGVRVACQIISLEKPAGSRNTGGNVHAKCPNILTDTNGTCERLQVWIYTKFPLIEVEIIAKKILSSLWKRIP